MATATAPPSTAPSEPVSSSPEVERRGTRLALVLGVLGVWVLLWFFTRGQDTLSLAGRERTGVMDDLGAFRDGVLASRDSNPLIQLTYGLGEAFGAAIDALQRLVSIPDFPRPVPQIGWLGVTAVATLVGYAIATARIALLVCGSFVAFGAFGYWSQALDLLIVTFVSVGLAVLIGMPLAVLIAYRRRAEAVITTVLDLMQTMPTFVYLLPIVLFFGIGASTAVVCTLIYALPPLIRIAGHGIKSVSATTLEATDSVGQTSWQRLTKVQLPMARKTLVVGLNQTTMAALSMATIASFVNGPGLGKPVLSALVKNDVGGAVVPGLLIVLMAVMLDRATTAASERGEQVARGSGPAPAVRRAVLVAGLVLAAVAVYVSRLYPWAAAFPETSLRDTAARWSDAGVEWFTGTFGVAASALADAISYGLLNPLQALLAESPWWLAGAAIAAVAAIAGGTRAAVAALVCLAGLRGLGLWHDAMVTLTMTLVATVLVMVLALVFGVWMARRSSLDLVLRPLLDMGQTIPPFVYLIPVLALFGPTRFTAIVAGVIYAAPAAIKLVADGVRGLPVGTLEASRSTGATTWQEITKVQLPMAKPALVLAANQGLLYVLAMAVIGGMVGAGALGYDVVLGFSRSEEWGKGAAAGLSIVLLGIMLDRVMRAAAHRTH